MATPRTLTVLPRNRTECCGSPVCISGLVNSQQKAHD
jgi:hypothetical protein